MSLNRSYNIKKRKEYHCYLLVFIIYNLQGILYQSGIINQLAQLTMILWAFVVGKNFLFSNPLTDNSLLRATKLLLLMYIVYGIINLNTEQPLLDNLNKPNSYVYLQYYLNSLLPILMFTRYAQYGILTHKELRNLFIIFFALGFLLMIKSHTDSLEAASLRNSSQEEFQNNASYIFVAFMPLALAFRKKLIQFLLIYILLAIIVYSMKRGAILTASIMALIFTIQSLLKAKKHSSKFGIIFLCLSIFSIEAIYISYQYESSPFFRERIENTLEGDDSGRGELKSQIIASTIKNLTLQKLLFGNGANSTVKFAGNYAHQDWIETWCNNGIIGIILLGYFYYSLFMTIKRIKKHLGNDMFIMYQMIFVACFLPTFFSMSIQDMRISITLPIGILCYMANRERNNSINNFSIKKIPSKI